MARTPSVAYRLKTVIVFSDCRDIISNEEVS